MDGPSLRIDLRVVAFATTVLAIAAVVGLLVASSSTEEALAQVALVLAIVALLADLGIALASHMASAQSEARMRETNTQMQAAISKLDARTDEIREHVLTQGGRMLDMLGHRLIEATPEQDRDVVMRVVTGLQKELREEPVKPPGGGLAGRRETLLSQLDTWAKQQGWQRADSGTYDRELYVSGNKLYVFKVAPGPYTGVDSTDVHYSEGPLATEWPDMELRSLFLLEEPDASGWPGGQYFNGTRIVTPSRLDEALLGPATDAEITEHPLGFFR